MKILINCLSAVNGGGIAYLSNMLPLLIEHFAASEHDCCMLMMKHQAEWLNTPTEHIIWLDDSHRSALRRLLWERRHLARVAKQNNIDRIFTPYQIHTHISSTMNIIMLRNMEPYTFHNYHYSLKNKLRNILLKQMTSASINKADRVIAVSDHVHTHSETLLGKSDKVTRIYHGRDDAFSPEQTSEDLQILTNLGIDYPFIFTCGSLLPYRNCEIIIQAYAQNIEQQLIADDIRLVIAGKSDDKAYSKMLAELISQTGLKKQIIMLGQVDKTCMQALYRHARLFVTASETEACPNIAIEAMASGCRIVASDSMPMPEIFQQAACYFKQGDSLSLAQVMTQNVSHKTPTCKPLALQRAADFSWPLCAQQTFELLVSTTS